MQSFKLLHLHWCSITLTVCSTSMPLDHVFISGKSPLGNLCFILDALAGLSSITAQSGNGYHQPL